MADYSKSTIYMIESATHELRFYGATTINLSKRMAYHRDRYRKGKVEQGLSDILQHDDSKIVLVEYFNCSSREELYSRLTEIIVENPNCNNHYDTKYDHLISNNTGISMAPLSPVEKREMRLEF